MNFYPFLLSLILLASCALSLVADSAVAGYSSSPPAVYTEQMRPLMTDIHTLLPMAAEFDASASDGVVLLNETVNWVAEDGKNYQLMQFAYVAVTDAAIEACSESVFVFRPDEGEKIYLIEAMSVQPDGTITAVDASGVFIQTPQREARSRIYSGQKELKIIYPHVKAGTTTYVCVLLEGRGRIPGELTLSVTWAGSWKRHLQRYVLEVPKDLAQRLTMATSGAVPKAVVQELQGGRTRLVWEQRDTNPVRYEVVEGDMHDIGPYVKASTLGDWDAFARWYAQLLEGVSKPSEQLREQVEQWVQGAQDREEIIDILFERVANDVRYTSINFGNGGVIPQSCNAVWQNKYGDCKDKANLLRVLLGLKGIRSHIVLVNTHHLGLAEKRTPDHYPFTHAIVAIENEDGSYLFCDPTASFATPGLLSPYSSDRDVLVVDAERGRGIWARTEPSTKEHIGVDFDLTWEADGSLRGWLTYTARGLYGASYMDSFRMTSRHQKESRARQLVQAFYRNAELIDFEHTTKEDWDGDFTLRVYFLIPGSAAMADSQQRAFVLPDINWLLPRVGERKTIATDAFIAPESIRVTFGVMLSQGWRSTTLPQPLRLFVPGLGVAGNYTSNADNHIGFELELTGNQSRFTPKEFLSLHNTLQSLGAWLSQPVNIHLQAAKVAGAETMPLLASNEAQAAAGAAAPIIVGTADFPVMPTAEGQLELALKRFPKSRDRQRARQALEAVVQYFPKEDSVVFDAKMYQAVMDWEVSKEEAALKTVNELIRTYSATLDKESMAWAYFVKGRSLQDLGREQEALAAFKVIAEDDKVSDFRRSWAEADRGKILLQSNPQEALAAFERAFALDRSEGREHFPLLAQALVQNDQAEELLQRLRTQLQTDDREAVRLLASTLEWVPAWQQQGRQDLLVALHAIMEELQAEKILDAEHAAGLAQLNKAVAAVAVKSELAAYIAQTPPSFWGRITPADNLLTREDFANAAQTFAEKSDLESAVRHTLEILLRFEPDEQFFYHLWRAAAFNAWQGRTDLSAVDEALRENLLAMALKNPVQDDTYIETCFTQGRHHHKHGDYSSELGVYRRLEQMNLETLWLSALYSRMGLAAELLGDYDAALEAYARLLPLQMEGSVSGSLYSQLRVIHIHLNRGDKEAALQAAQGLAQLGAARIETLEHAEQIGEWSELAGRGELLPVYWERWQKWWPMWEAFAVAIGLGQLQAEPYFVPDADFIGEAYAAIVEARKRNNAADYARVLAQLVDLARWHPERMSELLTNYDDIINMFPEQELAWRELFFAMYASLEGMPQPNWERQNHYWYVVSLNNAERFEEAYASLMDSFAVEQEKDALFYTLNRLYAMTTIALERDMDKAALRLEADLQDDALVARSFTVIWLANIYRTTGDKQAEHALLKRELEHPEVIAVKQHYELLKRRYESLILSEVGDGNLRSLTQDWLSSQGPDWLSFAVPHSLQDPRLNNLSRLLDAPEHHFSAAEIVKLRLLAIESDTLDVEAKRAQLVRVMNGINAFYRSEREWNNAVDTLLADARLSKDAAAPIVMVSAYIAFQINDLERVVRIWNEKEAYAPTENHRIWLDSLYEAAGMLDVESAQSLFNLGMHMVQKGKLNLFEVEILDLMILGLGEMGQMERVQQLYEATASISFGNDVADSKMARRLKWLRYLRASRELLPIYNSFSSEALALFMAADASAAAAGGAASSKAMADDNIASSTSAVDKPASTVNTLDAVDAIRFDSRALANLDTLPLEQRWQVLKRMLERNCFNRTDIGFLDAVATVYCDRYPLNTIDVVPLYATALDAAPNDRTRALLLRSLIYTVDYDDEAVRAAAAPLLARWRNDATNPMTRDLIVAEDRHLALRKGETIDWQAPVASVKHPLIPSLNAEIPLVYHFVRNDLQQLKVELEKLDEAMLTDVHILHTVIVCLKAAQMTDELELIQETGEQKVYAQVLEAWAENNLFAAKRAIRLADLLQRPDLIPTAFREHLANTADELERFSFLTRLAQLDKDWPAMEQASRQVLELQPNWYEFHWYLGKSLCEQGKFAEAAPFLQTFINYSGDSLNLPEAREWLERIKASESI